MGIKRSANACYGWQWNITSTDEAGRRFDRLDIQIILLQEIRDELKRLNTLLHCQNFQSLPQTLKRLDRRLAKAVPLVNNRTKGG